MAYWQPFYPIRNMLNAILFPLGFLLVAGGGLWIATARGWATEPVARGAPIYPRWGRIAAMLGVVVVLALLGLFAWREWIPYLWIYPGIASYEQGASTPATAEADYARAIAYCSRGLAINPDLADGYYFRALARRRRGEHQKAIDDLTHLIEARGQKLPHYRYARALSLDVVGERQAACDDIETALATRSWAMSPGTQAQAMKQCQEWKCDCPVPTSERRGR
jgi:tetratricopeptide (TPR) repeat protein